MISTTTRGSIWPSRIAYAAAGLFSAASGITNLLYGISKGSDFGSSLVWGAVSVGVSIVFALSWPATIMSADRKQWSRASMAVIALLLTGTYSVTAALGSAMGGRANAAIEQQDVTDKRSKAQAAYNTATAELATLKPSRPVAEVEALLEAAKPQCRIVVTVNHRDTVCTKPAALTAELGRAKRRVELEQKIEQTAADLAKTGPAKVANSDAVALATYLQGLGLNIDADRVNKLLVLLAVLVIECGGGLALAVGMALSGNDGHVADTALLGRTRAPTDHRTPQVDASMKANEFQCLRRPHGPDIAAATKPDTADKTAASVRFLDFLRDRGGVLVSGQRQIARSLGWSKSWTHEVLHDLASAGLVRLSTGKSGTVVRMAEASA